VRFIHYQVTAGPGDTIQVTLDAQANVWLMDTINYQKYRRGKGYTGTGGLCEKSPVDFRPSQHGVWHVIIDLAGKPGEVVSSVKVIR